jgi:hypothetical protein
MKNSKCMVTIMLSNGVVFSVYINNRNEVYYHQAGFYGYRRIYGSGLLEDYINSIKKHLM